MSASLPPPSASVNPTPLPSAARALILSRPSRDASLVPAACILVNATGGGGAGKLAKHGPDPLQRYAASARLAVVDPIRHQQPLTGKASRRRCARAVMRLAHLAIDDGHAGDELNALAVAAVMRRAQAKLWRGRQRGKRGAWCERVEEMAVPEAEREGFGLGLSLGLGPGFGSGVGLPVRVRLRARARARVRLRRRATCTGSQRRMAAAGAVGRAPACRSPPYPPPCPADLPPIPLRDCRAPREAARAASA